LRQCDRYLFVLSQCQITIWLSGPATRYQQQRKQNAKEYLLHIITKRLMLQPPSSGCSINVLKNSRYYGAFGLTVWMPPLPALVQVTE
jgi:hypothetical protein